MVTGRPQPREDLVSHNGLRQAIAEVSRILAAVVVGQKNTKYLQHHEAPRPK